MQRLLNVFIIKLGCKLPQMMNEVKLEKISGNVDAFSDSLWIEI